MHMFLSLRLSAYVPQPLPSACLCPMPHKPLSLSLCLSLVKAIENELSPCTPGDRVLQFDVGPCHIYHFGTCFQSGQVSASTCRFTESRFDRLFERVSCIKGTCSVCVGTNQNVAVTANSDMLIDGQCMLSCLKTLHCCACSYTSFCVCS